MLHIKIFFDSMIRFIESNHNKKSINNINMQHNQVHVTSSFNDLIDH